VAKFTEPQGPPGQPRCAGWGGTSTRPTRQPRRVVSYCSYGHTGFTGTSIWLDPSTQSYVILLANSVHPDGGRPALTPLRAKVATIVAAALGAGHNGATLTGLDVLAAQDFQPLQGKHVGLITNQTGVDRLGRRNVDLMRAAGVPVVALFSPEHGLEGREDRPGLADITDAASGIKVFSLYGKTLGQRLRCCAASTRWSSISRSGRALLHLRDHHGVRHGSGGQGRYPVLCARPANPITGMHVEGPLLDAATNRSSAIFPACRCATA